MQLKNFVLSRSHTVFLTVFAPAHVIIVSNLIRARKSAISCQALSVASSMWAESCELRTAAVEARVSSHISSLSPTCTLLTKCDFMEFAVYTLWRARAHDCCHIGVVFPGMLSWRRPEGGMGKATYMTAGNAANIIQQTLIITID